MFMANVLTSMLREEYVPCMASSIGSSSAAVMPTPSTVPSAMRTKRLPKFRPPCQLTKQ